MTIAVDASSPAAVSGSGATLVTGSFTPPDTCVIWAFGQADANSGANDETLSFSDSAGGTWSTPVTGNANGGAVVAAAWRSIPATSPGSMTVTMTDNKGSVAKRLFVRVFTGTDLTNPQGASTIGTTASISYTSTVANSWGWSTYIGSNFTITAGANTTLQDTQSSFDSGDAVATFSATTTTATPGTTVTLVEVGGVTPLHHVAVEILPPATNTSYAGPWTLPTPGRLGPTGQWSTQPYLYNAHVYGQSLAGTVTPSGALSKQDSKPLAGTVTPTGAATKQDNKALAGTVTPTGAITKQDNKALAGAVTPTGLLTKLASKAFAGSITPSGTLSTVKVILRAFGGTITPAGAVTRAASKGLAGTITPSGSLAKACMKALAGVVTPSAAVAKLCGKALSGVVAPLGTLAKKALKALVGVLGLSGALSSSSSGGSSKRAASSATVVAGHTSSASVVAERTSAPTVESD